MLSSLWLFALLNYLYCDVASLMDSAMLRQYLTGTVNGMAMTNPGPAAKPDLLKQAHALADTGALFEAANMTRGYLAAHPASADAYYLLGVIADAQGEQTEARGFYKRALYLDPEHGEALTHLAAVLGLEGDRAGAQLLLARAARVSGGRNE